MKRYDLYDDASTGQRQKGRSDYCQLDSLVEQVDALRLTVNGSIRPETRREYGQFMTPPPIGLLMASMFKTRRSNIRLLDPGAGVGSLTAAFVAEMLKRSHRPHSISVTAYEIDPLLARHLKSALTLCERICQRAGVQFAAELRQEDFIATCAQQLAYNFSEGRPETYDCAIMNPPYKKIPSSSMTRRNLRLLGMETSNIYTGFIALAADLLRKRGELVFISPRSFCNGVYFRRFRKQFLRKMALRRIHVFESRCVAFRDDQVLQENVIVHAVKTPEKPNCVALSVSYSPQDGSHSWKLPYDEVVYPDDPNSFIRLVLNDEGRAVAQRISKLPASLTDLELSVSTGRVVDFRAREHLRQQAAPGTVPLIYPAHFDNGVVKWPNQRTRKPNAIAATERTSGLLVPAGTYVLVKRFSAKEERRRIVAALYDSHEVADGPVGFENHLNYFHRRGAGLPKELGRGLCLFLNSSIVDAYFRQFSGHTQVNALDLESLKYPSEQQLRLLSTKVPAACSGQEAIDEAVDQFLLPAPHVKENTE